jgi:hypothetical protein
LIVARASWLAVVLALAVLGGVIGWAGFAPMRVASHEQLFEIPKGTWARRRAGDLVEILAVSWS